MLCKIPRCKPQKFTPYFTPFAGVNMPKYAYIMPKIKKQERAEKPKNTRKIKDLGIW